MIELSQLHRRVLAVRLRAVEEAIFSIRQALEGERVSGILIERVDPVPESSRAALEEIASELEARLKQLADELQLEPHQHSLRRDLVGRLNACWETLEDTRPRAMSGYGQMSPEAAAYLDPKISELCRLVLGAISILAKFD